MGSYSSLTYHIVFATKLRKSSITAALRGSLYTYLGGILRAKKGHAIEIGGVEDHVHLLVNLSPKFAVSDVIRDVKANGSRWMNEQKASQHEFKWQKGFGAFTVSFDKIPAVTRYIRNQQEHHKTKTFQDEYIEFLKRHRIEFRIEHLFEDEHFG